MSNEAVKLENTLPDLNSEKIAILESELLKEEQVDCPVVHRFGPGIYMRETTMPTGALVVGHHQNLEHMNFFAKGRMTLLMDGVVQEIKAPMMFTAKPGRKIAQIHEESVWINVYPNVENEQDIETLEGKYLNKSETFILSEEKRDAVLLGSSRVSRDYFEAIGELGISGADLIFDDIESLPFNGFKVKVSKSRIDGKGLFATAELCLGEYIGPVKINKKMTILGKYINHSETANAKFVTKPDGDIDLIATDKIFGCRGGFDGDEITVDYRKAFAHLSKRKVA